MTNTERIQANNAELRECIEMAENLPEAGDVGGLTQYAKFVAKPTTTTYFTVENPLGGIAKKITVRRLSDTKPSSRKIQDYIADLDTRMGVLYAVATSGNARYTVTMVDGSANNNEFSIKDGTITMYRYNSANTWDTGSEYEIEIWQ